MGGEETRFQAGRSGNPKGRPKGRGLVDLLAAELRKKVETEDGKGKVSQAQRIVEAWIDRTIHGSVGHLSEMLERLYGKVPAAEPEPPFNLSELTEEACQEAETYKPAEPPEGHPAAASWPDSRRVTGGDGPAAEPDGRESVRSSDGFPPIRPA